MGGFGGNETGGELDDDDPDELDEEAMESSEEVSSDVSDSENDTDIEDDTEFGSEFSDSETEAEETGASDIEAEDIEDESDSTSSENESEPETDDEIENGIESEANSDVGIRSPFSEYETKADKDFETPSPFAEYEANADQDFEIPSPFAEYETENNVVAELPSPFAEYENENDNEEEIPSPFAEYENKSDDEDKEEFEEESISDEDYENIGNTQSTTLTEETSEQGFDEVDEVIPEEEQEEDFYPTEEDLESDGLMDEILEDAEKIRAAKGIYDIMYTEEQGPYNENLQYEIEELLHKDEETIQENEEYEVESKDEDEEIVQRNEESNEESDHLENQEHKESYTEEDLEEEKEDFFEDKEVFSSTEEFEHFWNLRDQLEQEGKSPEEIEKVMTEAEEAYDREITKEKALDEAEKHQDQVIDDGEKEEDENPRTEVDSQAQAEFLAEREEELYQQGVSPSIMDHELEIAEQEEKLYSIIDSVAEKERKEAIDHTDEEEEEDRKEDIDRPIEIEHYVEQEEQLHDQGLSQDEIDEQMEENIDKFQEELGVKPKRTTDPYNLPTENDEVDEVDSDSQELDPIDEIREDFEQLTPEAIEEVKKIGEIEELEDNEGENAEETSQEDEKLSDRTELLHNQYQQETGMGPIYDGKETEEYTQWLQEKKEEQQHDHQKDQQEEDPKLKEFKQKARSWIINASEKLIDAELKKILLDILGNLKDYETWVKHQHLYQKLSEAAMENKLKNEEWEVLLTLMALHLASTEYHLLLAADIFNLKEYYLREHFFDRYIDLHAKEQFFIPIAHKYQILKKVLDKANTNQKPSQNTSQEAIEMSASKNNGIKDITPKEAPKDYDPEAALATILEKLKKVFGKKQFARIKTALEKIQQERYEGYLVIDPSGHQGALNQYVVDAIQERVNQQKDLSTLEQLIASARSTLASSAPIETSYPPLFLQGEWNGEKPSPYYPSFRQFMNELFSILLYHRVIHGRKELDIILGLQHGRNINLLVGELKGENVDGTDKSRVPFNRNEETLNTWLVRILNAIEQRHTVPNKNRAIDDVSKIFSTYYKKSGYAFYHPLYRVVKLMLYRMGEILLSAKVMNEFSIEKLDALLKSVGGSTCTSLYKNFQRSPKGTQKPETTLAFLAKVIEAAKSVSTANLSQEHEENIREIVQQYIDRVEQHRLSKNKLKGYAPTYRLKLIERLIERCEPLRKVLAKSMLEFNKLVFNIPRKSLRTDFLSDDSRPELCTLFRIIRNAYEWKVEEFNQHYGISLTKNDLLNLKAQVKEEVFAWILNAPYNPPLFHAKLFKFGSPLLAPELSLVYALWNAARLKTNNLDIDFEAIYQQRLYGNSPIHYNLKEGSRFLDDTVKLFRNVIQDWVNKESKKANKSRAILWGYHYALLIIGLYAGMRGLDLKGPIKVRAPPGSKGDFSRPQARIYNVILGLGRHLGFDPGFFHPLLDEVFGMTQDQRSLYKKLGKKIYLYIRHHILNHPDRTSMVLLEQVLIDTHSHFYWETLISEDDAHVCCQVLENLVKYDRPVDKKDIEQEFMKFGDKYRWLMENWFMDPKFVKNLIEFNKKKADIKTLPLDEFIKRYYPNAYKGLFVELLKKHKASVIRVIQKLHPKINISELIKIGSNDNYIKPFSRIFTEILKKYKYPCFDDNKKQFINSKTPKNLNSKGGI